MWRGDVSKALNARARAAAYMHISRMRMQVDFKDMLYLGPENRVCRDLSALGITCQRTPYGLSPDSWREALESFGQERC